MVPQTGPVSPTGSFAGVDFGFDFVNDPTTNITHFGLRSATTSANWATFPGATAAASSINGALSVFASSSGAVPSGHTSVSAHAGAGFTDVLTITSSSFPAGTLAYFDAIVTVTGSVACDTAVCPTGLAFGYYSNTLGLPGLVHQIGGELTPSITGFTTTQALVPLPFIFGQPFDVTLRLDTAARLSGGNTFNTADFSHTLRVSGLTITDASGAVLDASISGASGLVYSASGITAAPEPASVVLVGCGLALVPLVRFARLRRRGGASL